MKIHLNRADKQGLSVSLLIAAVIAFILIVIAYADLKSSTPSVSLSPSVSTTTSPLKSEQAETIHYENELYGFSFDYPKILNTGSDQHKASNDFDNLQEDSLFIASFPEDYATGTNLTSATFFSGVKKVNQNECYSTIYGNSATSTASRIPQSIFTIDGIEYSVISFTGAGAGSLYTTTRYSTMRDGMCYAFYIVGHSFNDIDTYNADHPDASVARYDHLILDYVLGKIIQSFTFTK